MSGKPAALCVGQWSEDVSNVVFTASGADAAGEHALVLVTRRRGDLGGVGPSRAAWLAYPLLIGL